MDTQSIQITGWDWVHICFIKKVKWRLIFDTYSRELRERANMCTFLQLFSTCFFLSLKNLYDWHNHMPRNYFTPAWKLIFFFHTLLEITCFINLILPFQVNKSIWVLDYSIFVSQTEAIKLLFSIKWFHCLRLV